MLIKFNILYKIALSTSLLCLQLPALALEKPAVSMAQKANDASSCQIQADNGETGEYSQTQLQTLAKRVTVRIIGDSNGGSGTLVARKGNSYLVLTNSHVIQGVNSIQLKTVDGKTYTAKTISNGNFEKFDLALLEFQSNQNYCLIEISRSIPETNTPVMAAGYSSEKGEIVFRPGTVEQVAEQLLKEGYSLGYTSTIDQGMSGGAIVSSQGKLIGVNGKSAYPILNTGYVLTDGSHPTPEQIQKMRNLSWGIPISTFLAQVNADILTAYALPLPSQSYNISQAKFTGWLAEIENKAKQFTVRIDSSSNANGSGIIIAKDGDSYTVLTAAHVVCETEGMSNVCGNYSYQILAPDGKQYPVNKSTIKVAEGLDLAVLKFSAKQVYTVATLANYNLGNNSDYVEYMFTGGYPRLGNNSPWRFTVGEIANQDLGLLIVNSSDFSKLSLGNRQKANFLTGGYELVYSSITYGGMSGGPVLDTMGRVIGIHGRAEAEEAYDPQTEECGSNAKCVTQIGPSLGIPVSTFLAVTSKLGVQPQKIENTRPSALNQTQINALNQALQLTDVPSSNATAVQWLERGNQLLRLERQAEAIKAFEQVIKLKPSFVHLAYLGKGWALFDQDKYPEAEAALTQAITYKSDFAVAWRLQSLMYMTLEQWDKALVAIGKTIHFQPENRTTYLLKSIVLLKLQRYAEAGEVINDVIKFSPSAFAYNIRANLYDLQKKSDLALADFNKAIQINPFYIDAYKNRALFYIEQDKSDLALADLDKANKLNPKSVDAYTYRALAYIIQQKWDLALTELNQYLKVDAKSADAYVMRGKIYTYQEKWDLALADYNTAIQLDAKNTDAYVARAEIYVQKEKLDLALADAKAAIQLNSQSVDAYFIQALIYVAQKKLNLAMDNLNKVMELNPQHVEASALRQAIYANQNQNN
jgi:tetratricopeptide (TPR) repeat protein